MAIARGCGYEELVVDLSDHHDSALSLEQECDRARTAWRDAMHAAGLSIGMGGFLQKAGNRGRVVLAWFRGSDEQIYYVILDLASHQVTSERSTSGRGKSA